MSTWPAAQNSWNTPVLSPEPLQLPGPPLRGRNILPHSVDIGPSHVTCLDHKSLCGSERRQLQDTKCFHSSFLSNCPRPREPRVPIAGAPSGWTQSGRYTRQPCPPPGAWSRAPPARKTLMNPS